MVNNKNIVVVGAGIAGISTAIHLVKNGFHVTVLEQNTKHGGRMSSFRDKTSSEIIDNGQHLMTGAYSNFLNIAKELGTSDLLNMQKSLKIDFYDVHTQKTKLDCSMFPGKIGILLGLLRMKNLSSKSKINIARLFLKIQKNSLVLNNLTVKKFLEKENQTQNSIRNFWEPITLATLNTSIVIASAELLITVLRKAFFSGKDNSKLIFPIKTLSSIIDPFSKWLHRNGSEIIFREKVITLDIRNNLLSAIQTKNKKYEAEAFVFCIPPNSMYRLLPKNFQKSSKFKALSKIKYSPIVSVYLWLDTTFPDIDFASMLGTKSQWLFNRMKICKNTNWQTHDYKARITITISNANELMPKPSKDIVNLCLSEIKTLFPEMKSSRVLHSKVVKIKNATMLQTPESQQFLPEIGSPIKNMFLAGDYIHTGLPATLESASLSGKIASEMIIEQYRNR